MAEGEVSEGCRLPVLRRNQDNEDEWRDAGRDPEREGHQRQEAVLRALHRLQQAPGRVGDPRPAGPEEGPGAPQGGQDPHQERPARLPARLPRQGPEEEPGAGAAGGPRQREEFAGASGASGATGGASGASGAARAGAHHAPLSPGQGERGRAPPGPPAPHEAEGRGGVTGHARPRPHRDLPGLRVPPERLRAPGGGGSAGPEEEIGVPGDRRGLAGLVGRGPLGPQDDREPRVRPQPRRHRHQDEEHRVHRAGPAPPQALVLLAVPAGAHGAPGALPVRVLPQVRPQPALPAEAPDQV